MQMGKEISARRLRCARAIGCSSADGTYLTYGPDQNLPRLLGWVREAATQTVLWEPP